MQFYARIFVTFKDGVLDPQGQTVLSAATSLGFKNIQNLRIGKIVELTLIAKSKNHAKKEIESLASRLLANPVIETYAYEIRTNIF